MELTIKNGQTVHLREFNEHDFSAIHQLNKEEGWNNLVEKHEDTKEAWKNSNIAYVATVDGEVIGCIRGFTDQNITLFICELIINKECRGLGLGRKILESIHSLFPKTRIDLVAPSTSRTYYEKLGYRTFYGFRKTIAE